MSIKLLSTVIASAAILYFGYSTMSKYQEKAAQQMNENSGVVSLRETWATLKPEVEKWNRTFVLDSTINDLNDVYEALGVEKHGLKSDSLMLNDAGRMVVKANDHEIGLSKTCLTNSSQGFVLQNESVSDYVRKLEPLLTRSDIDFNSLSLRLDINNGATLPYIVFDKLCVVLRGSDTFLEGII